MIRTEKELSLLKDMKNEEKLCTDKFEKHAKETTDPQLKELFNSMAQTERCHYEAVCKMEQGEVPDVCMVSAKVGEAFSATSSDKETDTFLCTDALSNEKHISHLFDTCIFEFNDEPSRAALNQIQKNEQEHGKMIYDYMKANNMYA